MSPLAKSLQSLIRVDTSVYIEGVRHHISSKTKGTSIGNSLERGCQKATARMYQKILVGKSHWRWGKHRRRLQDIEELPCMGRNRPQAGNVRGIVIGTRPSIKLPHLNGKKFLDAAVVQRRVDQRVATGHIMSKVLKKKGEGHDRERPGGISTRLPKMFIHAKGHSARDRRGGNPL